jgi:two-component system, response regulator YesN
VDAFLAANLHRPVTRRDIARAVHVSEPHLARTFREGTGKTLGRRLAQMRMERARALLAGSTMSVAEIAGEVGFASFSHFSKAFRDAHRMAPTEFRKRYGGG